ncbi:hypothetical protein GCM10028807_27800 [Spirosoma daeguense]
MATLQEKLKKFIVDILPKSLIYFIEEEYKNKEDFLYRNLSYSQEGEDLILNRLLSHKERGFYIDIGAHHPLRFSNTHLFYLKGWRGINIDPMSGSKNIFNTIRQRDRNLEVAISNKEEKIKYYIFSEEAYNTISENIAQQHIQKGDSTLVAEEEIICLPLAKILDTYIEEGNEIDFISIDVEGHELQVLESNNWRKYKPQYLLLEMYATLIEEIYHTNIHKYLSDLGYKLVARTPNTSLYKLFFS